MSLLLPDKHLALAMQAGGLIPQHLAPALEHYAARRQHQQRHHQQYAPLLARGGHRGPPCSAACGGVPGRLSGLWRSA
ncbi:Uncharacterised protein [Shimwellia blattae]|nr:Uncharacterised protein [Shimwellia blattae]